MKYFVFENAMYEVEADSPKAALELFKRELKAPFPCAVDQREIYDENQNDVTAEADDQ
jgi:hypothetical protein